MRGMVLQAPKPISESSLQLETLPDPEPGPDELTLEVGACAVCRTDLQIAEGDILLHKQPVIPGHQVVGTVTAIGGRAQGWSVGDTAGVAWLAATCGECPSCVSGRENLCPNARFTGWDRDGGYADRITVRADFAVPLPSGLDPVAAAPLLCGGVIGYRALRRSGIEPGQRLGLFGYGASAHLALQVAKAWGCEVYVCTRSEKEQRRALENGATWAGSYDATPPVLLQAAVTFAPAGWVVIKALQAVDRGGIVAINAIHLDEVPSFSYDSLWLERELRSVANFTRQDAAEFMRLAAEIPVVTATQTFRLEQANEALQELKTGHLNGTPVLLP